MYKLHFDNFLINEHDDDDDVLAGQWTYSNGHLSICVYDAYRVTTCRPVRGHIVAAARLHLVCLMIGFCATVWYAILGFNVPFDTV